MSSARDEEDRGRGASPRLGGFPPAGALGAEAARWGAELSPEPRFLILGSFPSVQSLERREYYGNPRNHFWRVVATCLGLPEPTLYDAKLAMLREGRIALWDLYAACERRGSLDKNITAGQPNPVADFVARRPAIEAIGLNGGTAAAAFVAYLPYAAGLSRFAHTGDCLRWSPSFAPGRRIIVARLPSTSPVPTVGFKTADEKIPIWERFFTIQM